MASLRDIFVRLGLKTDPSGFKNADNGLNRIKESAVTLGRVLATGAVAYGFKSLIGFASDIAETSNKFGAVFGKQVGPVVQQQLDDIRKRTGATNLELQTMSSSIGALIKPSLGSAQAAGAMAAQVSELALDISSFNNVTSEDALTALRSGLIGSAEPLQRFGVDVRVAALQQEALRQGIKKSVQKMTEGERIALRYAAIHRQLSEQGAVGDAARTSKDFANASRNLIAALKETAGVIGSFLLGSVKKAVNSIREVTDAVQDWLKENRKLVQQRVNAFIERFSRVVSAVSDFIGDVSSAVSDWASSLTPLGQQILRVTAVVLALVAVMMLPGVPILMLIALIALLIEDFQTWRAGGESVIGDIIGWFEQLIETVRGYGTSLTDSIDSMLAWVEEHQTGITMVTSLIVGLAGAIGSKLVAANAQAIGSFLGFNSVVGKWIRFHLMGARIYARVYLAAARNALLSSRAWVVSSLKTMKAWLFSLATMNRAQWRWMLLGAKINATYYVMSAKRAVMSAGVWIAAEAKKAAAAVASAAATSAAWVGAHLKMAAAWLMSTGAMVLTIALIAIIIGTLVFLGAELVKLALGQENFFTTMSDGISDLIDEWGGLGGAIGAMLDTALRYWLTFFGKTDKEVDEWIENATDTLMTFWDGILDYWSDAIGRWWDKWSDIIDIGIGGDDEEEIEKRAKKMAELAAARRRAQESGVIGGPQTVTGPQRVTAPVMPGGQTVNRITNAQQTTGGARAIVDNSRKNYNIKVETTGVQDDRKLADRIITAIEQHDETKLRQTAQAHAVGAP